MRFVNINEESIIYPGEYLLHIPTNQIVLCGAFNYHENFIRCLNNGKLMTDTVDNFNKIQASHKEQRKSFTKCKGCSGVA